MPRSVSVALISVLFGLLAGALFMLLSGNNPVRGYTFLFRGGLMNIERIGNTLATATPLILTGLSVAFAFKTGLFNIGASGQVLMGGLCATALGLTVTAPKPLMLLLMLLVAVIGGAVWGFIPGLLKALFNVHEVVSTIMMNWLAFWIVNYTVPAYFKGDFLETESRRIPEAASLRLPGLSEMFNGSYVNLGLVLAILAVIGVWVLLEKTVLGYELKAAGYNRYAAEYGGMKVNSIIVMSMTIAGALSGLAGLALYAGYAVNIQIGILPTQGFDGIAVAFLGGLSPLGSLLAALFFGLLHSGKGFMNAMTNIPPEIGDTIIAILLYFSATSVLIERLLNSLKNRRENRNWAKNKKAAEGAESRSDSKREDN
ncbi:MAG: sugar ABC transporter permease [Spirochaetales bacterium]|nr:MAG: sugar ABC transporter permease [Spirochaetales bacterium]